MPDNSVKIAGGQGFYGDTPAAVDALLEEGIDYLCLEALAELTLAILQKDRQRDESRGYTRDLPAYLSRSLPHVADGRTKVTFTEEYEAFNPIMRVLFEKRVHEGLSRDNDTILAALNGGLAWHRRRKEKAARTAQEAGEAHSG
jgi:hypothetical protein